MTELFPGAWRGVFAEKNGFGGLMAFAFLIFAGAALLVCGFLIVVMGFFPGTLYKTFASRVMEDTFHLLR